MINVLLYLFESYIYVDSELILDQKKITNELLKVGFRKTDIIKAMYWLEKLATQEIEDFQISSTIPAISTQRIFDYSEQQLLNVECRGLLYSLEQAKILSPQLREMVIDRVMELEVNEIQVEDLKWIILLVLFNLSGQEDAFKKIENLFYQPDAQEIH